MTAPPLSEQCQRIIALQEQLTEAIDCAECSWAEAVGVVGFALAELLNRHCCEAMRVAMAQQVAQRLVAGAWTQGSFGIPERMQ